MTASPYHRLWLFGMAFCIFGALCLPNFGYYHDAVADAGEVQYGTWLELLHPHHLGSSVGFKAWWLLGTTLGIDWSPFTAMHILTRIASLIACLQLWLLGQSAGLNVRSTALLVLAYGCAFTTWNFGTTGAVYPAALIGAWAIFGHLLVVLREGDSAWTLRRSVRLSAWLLWAILWHQLAVFLVVPILWTRWYTATSRRWPSTVSLAGLLAVPPIAVYLVAGYTLFQTLSIPHLLKWATRFGQQSRWWYWSQVPDGESPVLHWAKTIVNSHGRVLWALPHGEPFSAVPGSRWMQILQSSLPSTLLDLLTALLVVGLIAGLVALWRWSTQATSPTRTEFLLLLVWTAPFFLFTCAFMPQNAFYRLYYLVPILWLLVRWLDDLPVGQLRNRSWLVVACIGGLSLLINVAYGWGPRAGRGVNPRIDATQLTGMLPDGLLVISEASSWDDYVYARAFLNRPLADGRVPQGDSSPALNASHQSGRQLWLHPVLSTRLRPQTSLPIISYKLVLKDSRSSSEPETLWIQPDLTRQSLHSWEPWIVVERPQETLP